MATGSHFQKLLNRCQEMELSHLRPLVDRMFENAEVALLEFAEKAENNMLQTLFFDAMREVQRKRPVLEHTFYDEVRRGYSGFPLSPFENHKEEEDSESVFGSFSLVDTEEMDESIATRNTASKLSSRIREQVFALKQRLAVINAGQAIHQEDIPGGPEWLGRACQLAVDELELETRIRLVVIALFDKYIFNNVDELFNEYNALLIQADILPNLKYEVQKQPGSVTPIRKTDAEDDQNPLQAQGDDPEVEPELGDELFGRICDLLSTKRYSPGGAPQPGKPGQTAGYPAQNYTVSHIQPGVPGVAGPGVTAAGNPAASSGPVTAAHPNTGSCSPLVAQIQNVQSQIQVDAASMNSEEFISSIEVDEKLISRLQQTLSDERSKIFGSVDASQLPAADTNVIELVGMLFEYMLKEENLPDIAKALLSRLHTPLLKVAVIDRNFFTHNQYPARKLLNSMIGAGIRWIDTGNIERGIFPTMKTIVDRVLDEFVEDVSLFKELVDEFEADVEKLHHRASTVEQRTNEAANGQEKLEAARDRVQQEISGLEKAFSISEETREFLQRIWADKMTFILLRNPEGDQSNEWQDAVTLMATIIEFSRPPCSETERQQHSEELAGHQQQIRTATQNLQQPEKEKLLIGMFGSQQIALKQESADLPTPEPQAEESQPEAVEEKPAEEQLSSEKLATIERLKDVSFGTWFEFRKQAGNIQRAKLSWRSTITEKFMFVDQMGVKAAIIDMHKLADCMMDGSVHIMNNEKSPFVDRALKAIHRVLDIGTSKAAHA